MSTRDYRRIVEDIQIALSQSAVPLDAVYAMSVEYAAACDEINVRLRECHDLLRRGLRGEALQRCELDPKLLDVVTTLDFPELPSWVSVLSAQRLVTPPPLLIEVAGELNEAFALERPLAAILRKHRLLALARAPLKDRIVVLRKLATVDANVPVWDEDLRNWERARHMEIDRDSAVAMAQKNADRLSDMERELRNSEWREPPEGGLVQRISGMATELRMKHARNELQTLIPQLTAAYQEFDVAQGRMVRSQWQSHALAAALQPNNQLSQMAAPCLIWLDEEDRKEALRLELATAEGRLTQALDEDMPPVEVERRYNDLLRLEQGVNEQLAARFLARMEQHRLTVVRKHRLIMTGLAAGILLASGLTVMFVVRHQRASETEGYVTALNGLLDTNKLPEAGEFIVGLEAKPEYVRTDAKVLELVARYNSANQAEVDRQTALRDALTDVERSVSGKPTINTLQEGRRMLGELLPRALTVPEQNQIAHLDADIAGKIRGIEAENAMAYGQEIDALRDKVNRLKAGEVFGYANRSQAIKEILDEAKRVVESGKGLPQALVSNASILQTQLDSMAKLEAEEQQQKILLRSISDSIGNLRAYRDALSIYLKVFSKTSRAHDFIKILENDLPVWDRVVAWNAFIAKHSKLDVATVSSTQATALVTEFKTFLTDHGDFPGAEVLREKIPHLESLALRNGPSGALKDALNAPFKDYTVADLYFVREKDGATEQNYYTLEDLKLPDGKLSAMPFSYITDADRSVPLKPKSLKRSQVAVGKNSMNVEVPVMGPAPQSAFAAEATRKLRTMRDAEWETTFQQIILDLRDSRYMDPVVKVQLLTYVMSVAGQGSYSLQAALKPELSLLQGIASEVAVNWIDPEDPKAVAARKTAQSVLNDVSSRLEQVFDDVKKSLGDVARPPENRTYEWIGWLQLNTTGKWVCNQKPLPPDFSAELCLIVPAGSGGGTQFEPIGKIQQGTIQLNTESAALLEGRPVFAVHTNVP